MVTTHDLRCFCSRRPLLATYGINDRGKLYIEVKVYKQRKIYGHVVIESGIVRLQCRECNRWQRVIIREKDRTATLKEDQAPVLDSSATEN